MKDDAHRPFADFLNETRCTFCAKKFGRLHDVVKHERGSHGETYTSRLDKFLGSSVPPSPPSSVSPRSCVLENVDGVTSVYVQDTFNVL